MLDGSVLYEDRMVGLRFSEDLAWCSLLRWEV